MTLAPSAPGAPTRRPAQARSRRLAAALVGAVAAGLLALPATPAAAADTSAEAAFVQKVNAERVSRGLPALSVASDLVSVARAQSDRMAAQNRLYHNPNLSTDVQHWTRLSENVGYGGSVDVVQTAFMGSAGHAANILDRGVSQIGVGVTWSGSRLWVTQVFRMPSASYVPPAPAAPTQRLWLLRESPDAGGIHQSFGYGSAPDTTLACDFDGDGADNHAVYRDGWWAVRTAAGPGPANAVFQYGDHTMKPVCGDWDGDGKAGVGVYDLNGFWWLRETPTPGAPQRLFQYGWRGATPVTGSWSGDAAPDGIGVFAGGTWMLRRTATPGTPDAANLSYGWSGATPVPGDWNGDGRDTLGVYADGGWWLRDELTPGQARTFGYGDRGYAPVVGDWDGYLGDGVGVTRPS